MARRFYESKIYALDADKKDLKYAYNKANEAIAEIEYFGRDAETNDRMRLHMSDLIGCFMDIKEELLGIYQNVGNADTRLERIDYKLEIYFDLVNISETESECIENIIEASDMIINGEYEM